MGDTVEREAAAYRGTPVQTVGMAVPVVGVVYWVQTATAPRLSSLPCVASSNGELMSPNRSSSDSTSNENFDGALSD